MHTAPGFSMVIRQLVTFYTITINIIFVTFGIPYFCTINISFIFVALHVP